MDVYACGVLLFEMLLGAPCFEGEGTYDMMRRIIDQGPAHARLQAAGVPIPLRKIVQRATAFLPAQRYANAREMAEVLDDWNQSRDSGSEQLATMVLRMRQKREAPRARMDSQPTELIPLDHRAA